MNNLKPLKRSLLSTSMLLALGAHTGLVSAFEYGANNNNFTLTVSGTSLISGSNLIKVTWDGTLNTDVVTAVSNMTIAFPSQQILPISNGVLTAGPLNVHDVKVFGPGTYVFEACPAPIDGGTSTAADGSTNCTVSAPITMVVGSGQMGAHMLVDSAGGDLVGINGDLINVWDTNAKWGYSPNDTLGTGSRLQGMNTSCYTGKGADLTTTECKEFFATEWFLAANDADATAVAGMKMLDGPFSGLDASFNIRKQAVSDDAVFAELNTSVNVGALIDNDQLTPTTGTFTVTEFDIVTEQGGIVTDNEDGTFEYLPPVDFTGLDRFTYTIDDGVDHADSINTPAGLGAEGHYKATANVDIVVLSSSSSAPGALSDTLGGIGATGVLALPLMLLLLPLRLFSRKK